MVEMGGKRGVPMQPLRGWYFKPRFFPQGGASLTLGCDMEPLRGSSMKTGGAFSQGGASLTLGCDMEPLRGSSMKTGGAFSQGGASLTPGYIREPFQGSRSRIAKHQRESLQGSRTFNSI